MLLHRTLADFEINGDGFVRLPINHPLQNVALTRRQAVTAGEDVGTVSVLPPVSKLSPEQAAYYFINGYTSKLAGTEAGVTEPVPNFSACFGSPFMPRRPTEYARMLTDRIAKHGSDVWLLNTGWTGGGHGTGHRFSLKYTRAMVHAILDGSLAKTKFTPDPIFGLPISDAVSGAPR